MSMLDKIKKIVQKSSDRKRTTVETKDAVEHDASLSPVKKMKATNVKLEKTKKKTAATNEVNPEIIKDFRSVAESKVTREDMAAYINSDVQESKPKSKNIRNPSLVREYENKAEGILSEAEKWIIPHEEKELAVKANRNIRKRQKQKQRLRNIKDGRLKASMTNEEYKELTTKKNSEKNLTEEELNLRRCNTTRRAVQYLSQWKNDRTNWKFSKGLQIRLLKFMYKPEGEGGIPKEHFQIFMEYCNTELPVQCKNVTRAKAQSVMDERKDDFRVQRADIVLKSLSDN